MAECTPQSRFSKVWFANQSSPDRTIGELDPKTGRVSSYELPGKDGVSEEIPDIQVVIVVPLT